MVKPFCIFSNGLLKNGFPLLHRSMGVAPLIYCSCLILLSILQVVGGLGLSWQLSFGILVLLYFYSHYFFASGAAHIGAMFTAFLSVASALGTPPYLGALVLSFLSNLMGGITHYGIGSAPVFYGANYVPLAKWWGYGFVCSIVNLIIWLGVGGIWWKAIGLW